jgi:glycine cleavage system aminomethyltransferase T
MGRRPGGGPAARSDAIGPCHIKRIEAGILALGPGYDMWYDTNPYEVEMGYQRMVHVEQESDFIGKEALRRIKDEGVKRKLVGVEIGGERVGFYNDGSTGSTSFPSSRTASALGR